MKKICMIIMIIVSICFTPLIAYSSAFVGALAGYAVGKSGQVVGGGSSGAVFGVLPVECHINADGTCGIGSSKRPIENMCSLITHEYKPVGFMPSMNRNYIFILCAKTEKKK